MSVQDRNDQAVDVLGADFPYPAQLKIAHFRTTAAGGDASYDITPLPTSFTNIILRIVARSTKAASTIERLTASPQSHR